MSNMKVATKKFIKGIIYKFFPNFRINKFDDEKFLIYVYKKKIGILQCANKIETLALRGSGADYDFLDRDGDTSYNLGLTSSDLHATYHLHRFATDVLPNLKNILIFFVPIAPGLDLSRTKERYRCVAYKFFFNVPYQSKKEINKAVEKMIFNKCRAIKKPSMSDAYRGYEKKPFLSAETDVEKRAEAHLRENRREPDQMHWLEALLSSADRHNQKVWIIIPPVRSDFKEKLPESGVLFSKLYDMSLGKHEIINFYNDNNFDDSDHGDTDHLNEKGAEKLTHKIMSVLEEDKNNCRHVVL